MSLTLDQLAGQIVDALCMSDSDASMAAQRSVFNHRKAVVVRKLEAAHLQIQLASYKRAAIEQNDRALNAESDLGNVRQELLTTQLALTLQKEETAKWEQLATQRGLNYDMAVTERNEARNRAADLAQQLDITRDRLADALHIARQR